MSALWLLIILVALLRLAELTYAGRNTKRLLAEGGIEAGGLSELSFPLSQHSLPALAPCLFLRSRA